MQIQRSLWYGFNRNGFLLTASNNNHYHNLSRCLHINAVAYRNGYNLNLNLCRKTLGDEDNCNSKYSRNSSKSRLRIVNSSNTDNKYSLQTHRSFFNFGKSSGGGRESPMPVFLKRKKDNGGISRASAEPTSLEPKSLKSRIVGFFLSKLMSFVAKTIHGQLEEMEKAFDKIVTHAESALNSDPRLTESLGSDIEIIDIRSVDGVKVEHNGSTHGTPNSIENAESDKNELKLDNVVFHGSKGVVCSGSLYACEEDDGSGDLILKKLQVILPNGRKIDVKIPNYSKQVIDIKVK
jgi:hypothetical protein